MGVRQSMDLEYASLRNWSVPVYTTGAYQSTELERASTCLVWCVGPSVDIFLVSQTNSYSDMNPLTKGIP